MTLGLTIGLTAQAVGFGIELERQAHSGQPWYEQKALQIAQLFHRVAYGAVLSVLLPPLPLILTCLAFASTTLVSNIVYRIAKVSGIERRVEQPLQMMNNIFNGGIRLINCIAFSILFGSESIIVGLLYLSLSMTMSYVTGEGRIFRELNLALPPFNY